MAQVDGIFLLAPRRRGVGSTTAATCVLLFVLSTTPNSQALTYFSAAATRSKGVSPSSSSSSSLSSFQYGRGADIWPECNEDPVQLQDSFPNGQIPYSAMWEVGAVDMQAVHENARVAVATEEEEPLTTSRRKQARFWMSQTVRRLLRKAAAKEELSQTEGEAAYSITTTSSSTLDALYSYKQSLKQGLPLVLALGLVATGGIRPLDILVVASVTTYTILLTMVARSPRQGALAPIMPALPPQGHVPTLVAHPLGLGAASNRSYYIWLRTGVWLGMILPLVPIVERFMSGGAAADVARPLFLLCCQAITEISAKRKMVPLPIRILIPIVYNIARLPYLWQWASTAATTSSSSLWGNISSQALGILNLGYTSLNLLAFLIPIALVRYMRAYFWGVEATEVVTRVGMEETLGMIPNLQ